MVNGPLNMQIGTLPKLGTIQSLRQNKEVKLCLIKCNKVKKSHNTVQ